ncbi:MAG: DUF2807 domain-containing protein [Fimbriimonadaceae bacterium]|nr:DUF2807 domain-containing protein [Fimbriimonadaceae bacterium]
MQFSKLLLAVAFGGSVIALNGCMVERMVGGPQVKGSGNVKSETRKVDAFTKVQSAGPFNVELKIGSPQSVSVSADDNILEIVRTEVKDGTLIIDSSRNFSSTGDIKVTIVVPSLEDFSASGSGDSTLTGLEGKTLGLTVTGSGSVRASGKCDFLVAEVTGSGSIQAGDLTADEASARVTGSGEIHTRPITSLKASITGSGDIVYASQEKLSVTKNVTGSGDVRAK